MQKCVFSFFVILFHFIKPVQAQVVKCDHPLLQEIEQTLPAFKTSELNYAETRRLYRGVQSPQFNDQSIVQFLFHDPYTFSAGKLLTQGSTLAVDVHGSGAWATTVGASDAENAKQLHDRWDAVLALSAIKMGIDDPTRDLWNIQPYYIFNTSSYYDFFQFASKRKRTAKGYGSYIMQMDIPVARFSPSMRHSDKATVIPLLIAPWEVSSVKFYYDNIVLVKHFEKDPASGQDNRCKLDYITIKGKIKTLGYLSLCALGTTCNRDPGVMSKLSSGLQGSLNTVKVQGQEIQVTRRHP